VAADALEALSAFNERLGADERVLGDLPCGA